jgi:type IV secretion system protein TrbB
MQITEGQARVIEKIEREMGELVLANLRDPSVVEIMLNPDGKIWVEKLGHDMQVVGTLPVSSASSLICSIASYVGAEINESNPILECELPSDGSRFEALFPPIVQNPVFSIRKKASSIIPLDQYVEQGILSAEFCKILRNAVAQRKNILVSGGTATGKTTFANALIAEIPIATPKHRILVLEDTREIQCFVENNVMCRTSDAASMNRLLRATLRLRPDRIVVGEVRGGEALDLLKAWNTGHPGGIGTLHANDALSSLDRLEQLVGEVTEAPMQKLIASAIDLVVSIEKTKDGRIVREIMELEGFDGRSYVYKILRNL